MLSMISIPLTALAVGLPAQRAIAQRFSALAHLRRAGRVTACPLSGVLRSRPAQTPGADNATKPCYRLISCWCRILDFCTTRRAALPDLPIR